MLMGTYICVPTFADGEQYLSAHSHSWHLLHLSAGVHMQVYMYLSQIHICLCVCWWGGQWFLEYALCTALAFLDVANFLFTIVLIFVGIHNSF